MQSQGLEPRNISLPLCLIHCLSTLSLSLLFVHSIIHIVVSFISCMLELSLHLIHIAYLLYAWIVVCASLILNHKSFTQHLNPFKGNQEELVQSPSRGIRLHLCVVLSVLQNLHQLPYLEHLVSRLALTPIHPPLGVLSIGIRANAPDIQA